MTPNDGETAGAVGTAEVLVVNTPPEARVTLAPEAPTTDDDLVATAIAEDADDDPVTLAWAWTADGVAQEEDADTVAAARTAHGEVWAVTVTAADDEAAGAPATAQVAIANSAPVVLSVTLAPEAPYATEDVTALVEASDADGDAVTSTYTWFVDGTEVQTGPSDTLAAGRFAKHQRISVEVVPNDGRDAGAAFLSADAVVLNRPPTAAAASVSPDPAYEGSVLTCVTSGYADADGDAASWRWSWTVDGVEAATTGTLDGAAFDRGDRVGCVATPDDGEETGEPVSSAAVTIANSAPVLSDVLLSTYAPTEEDTVTVTLGAATDADGDAVTHAYAWYVDGAVVGTGTSLLANRFAKGDVIQLVVTPSDGIDDGTPIASATATAANTPPTLTALTLSPDPADTDDVLTVAAAATDLDGDPVTYTYDWYVDGRVRGSYTSASLDGAWFDKGQAVVVVVTPNDGEDDGAPGTGTVLVANSPPGAPTARITPTHPSAGDDLSCAIDAVSTDADGDAVSYTFTWTVDGVAFLDATDTATESTVAASDAGRGSRWTCAAVATDGEAASAPATATVEVCADADGDGYTAAACGREDCRDDDDALHPYDTDGDGVIDACGWRDLAVIGTQACAIDSDQRLACWGTSGTVTPDTSSYLDVSGFYGTACGLLADGTLACWGMAAAGDAYGPPAGLTFARVAAGTQISVGVATDGEVYVWGWNTYSSTPTLAGYDGQAVAANYHAVCWLDPDGNAACSPGSGTIGFAPDNTDAPYSAVAIGNGHGCVLRASDGTALCFGDSSYGQLSAPPDALTAIVAGLETTCGLREDGTVACWGNDDFGATDAPADTVFERLAAGYNANYGVSNFCGVTADQAVVCWGVGSGDLERE